MMSSESDGDLVQLVDHLRHVVPQILVFGLAVLLQFPQCSCLSNAQREQINDVLQYLYDGDVSDVLGSFADLITDELCQLMRILNHDCYE